MTSQLYYEDAYIKEIDTKVVDCIPIKDSFGIILEQTIFYPEGGGQPGDQGTINGLPVFDTIKQKGKILHLMKEKIAPGLQVKVIIDWAKRYDLMQFHTAQHLISGVFWELLQAETMSVHVSENSANIELKLDYLDWKRAEQVESRCNELINQAIPVKIQWIQNIEDIQNIPLRRSVKKTSERGIRIVEIEDYDYSACGGMHLKNVAEIGLLKIERWSNVKNNVQVEFLFGTRALKDYAQKNRIILELMKEMTCQSEELVPKMKSFQTEIFAQKTKIKELHASLLNYNIPEMMEKAKNVKDIKILSDIFEDLEADELKRMTNSFLETPNVACLFVNSLPQEKKIGLVFAHSIEDNPLKLHMGKLIKLAVEKINGKGGGKPQYAQAGGYGDIPENYITFLENLVISELEKK